jgi:hypothetical protein
MPITDRLQRLYAHEETAKMMLYHQKTPRLDDDDVIDDMMLHPCDGEAWQPLVYHLCYDDYGTISLVIYLMFCCTTMLC